MTDHTPPLVSPLSWPAIERWLAGACPSDEAAQVQAALHASPDAAALIETYRAALAQQMPALSAPDVDAMIVSVQQTIARQPVDRNTMVKHTRARNLQNTRRIQPLFKLISVIATAAAIILISQWPSHATSARAATVYTTNTAQVAHLRLNDGTQVMLAPHSTLTVDTAFGTTARMVTLHGEAYFHVSSHTPTPFTVRAGTVTTRVLGTEFDVQYDPPGDTDTSPVRVAVMSGKVAVHAPHTLPVTVSAGHIGIAGDSSVQMSAIGDRAVYMSWTEGRLVFRKTPIPELLDRVGRWYGYEFRLADADLAAQHMTVVFDNRPVSDVLSVLRGVLHVTMTFNGNVITLHPMTTPERTPAQRRHDLTPYEPLLEAGR